MSFTNQCIKKPSMYFQISCKFYATSALMSKHIGKKGKLLFAYLDTIRYLHCLYFSTTQKLPLGTEYHFVLGAKYTQNHYVFFPYNLG